MGGHSCGPKQHKLCWDTVGVRNPELDLGLLDLASPKGTGTVPGNTECVRMVDARRSQRRKIATKTRFAMKEI